MRLAISEWIQTVAVMAGAYVILTAAALIFQATAGARTAPKEEEEPR